MLHPPWPTVLDACVLYPSLLRDLLMHLGLTGLYQPKWTDHIQQEWQRSLLAQRPDICAEQLRRTETLMNQALPDARIVGYEDLIEGLNLPDPDDRHVLAAAIRSGATAIVTTNLRDFPAERLTAFGIEALDPDVFVCDLFDLNNALVIRAVRNASVSLRMPPFGADEYLACLQHTGLPSLTTALQPWRLLL